MIEVRERSQENKGKTEIHIDGGKIKNLKIQMGRKEGTKQKTEGRREGKKI